MSGLGRLKVRVVYDGPVVSRKDARALGLKRYFSGLSCPAGHTCQRNVGNMTCIYCQSDKNGPYVRAFKARGGVGRVREIVVHTDGLTTKQRWRSVNKARCNTLSRARRAEYRLLHPVVPRVRKPVPKKRVRRSLLSRPYKVTAADRLLPGSRVAALLVGFGKYFTGSPCVRGHISPRYVKKRKCVRCAAEDNHRRNQEYPEKAVAAEARRRALAVSAGGSFTAADIAVIWKLQKGRCASCRVRLRKGRFHCDHIMPLFRGGSNDRRNIQLTCEPCNLSKGARDPIEHNQIRTRSALQPMLL